MTEHEKDRGHAPIADGLKRNPGIGQSKGTFATGHHPQTIKGENTTEGDVDNDSTVTDGVPERERGRANREPFRAPTGCGN